MHLESPRVSPAHFFCGACGVAAEASAATQSAMQSRVNPFMVVCDHRTVQSGFRVPGDLPGQIWHKNQSTGCSCVRADVMGPWT